MAAILLIEDDNHHLEFLADTVKFGGHEAYLAKDTNIANRILTQQQINLIVTDISLPGMSGLDYMALLSEQNRQLPFIVVTGCANEEYKQKARQLNAIDFLIKPIDPERLLRSIANGINEGVWHE